jgi:hypothetical protein
MIAVLAVVLVRLNGAVRAIAVLALAARIMSGTTKADVRRTSALLKFIARVTQDPDRWVSPQTTVRSLSGRG